MKGEYLKYQHVEKLGSDSTEGILEGKVYVFPKLDGTNAHAWCGYNEDGEPVMCYGSRNRELALGADNAGFMNSMLEHNGLTDLCVWNDTFHVYGEWLVPHSLKTYRDTAWRQFYVFDIVDIRPDGSKVHLPYEDIKMYCEEFGLDYIAPLRIFTNPSVEQIMKTLEENTFLIKDGEGVGEGVVIKNYDYTNKYGRQTWAKVVTSEFKERHRKTMGAPITKGTDFVEEKIVEQFVTKALVEKTKAKIEVMRQGWESSCIKQLLSTVFHDLVTEHTWDAIKKHKNPKVDFKVLNRFCTLRIKQLMPEVF